MQPEAGRTYNTISIPAAAGYRLHPIVFRSRMNPSFLTMTTMFCMASGRDSIAGWLEAISKKEFLRRLLIVPVGAASSRDLNPVHLPILSRLEAAPTMVAKLRTRIRSPLHRLINYNYDIQIIERRG